MKTHGTKIEVLKYLTEEFSLTERPLWPKVGDVWQCSSNMSFENQLNSLTKAESMVFYTQCTKAPTDASDPIPQFEFEIKTLPVTLTDFQQSTK